MEIWPPFVLAGDPIIAGKEAFAVYSPKMGLRLCR